MKKMMYVINPAAGRGGFRSDFGNVLELFYRGGYVPSVFMTAGQGDATTLVSQYAGAFDAVVCQGGDGTVSEIVSGLVELPSPPPFGYIPMGTTNDLATSLGIPKYKPLEAAELILNGRPTPLDVGSFGDSAYFTYIAAFGAFTGVSYETPQNIKHTLGPLAYFIEGMKTLPKLSAVSVRVEYDDGVIEDELVFGGVSNSLSIAGVVKLDKNIVGLGDGLFELILIRNPHGLADMNSIMADLIQQNYKSECITIVQTKTARFFFEKPIAWTRDGENGGEHLELTLVNNRAAVNILL